MTTITEKEVNQAMSSVTDAASVKVIQSNNASGKMTMSNLAAALKPSINAIDTGEPTGGIYESVDLGLPSGTLWAKHNVGAKLETEYGDMFAWGATKPYRVEGSTVYDNTANYSASRANSIQRDPNPNEDAATVNMGAGWRMPTKQQLQELIDYTTNEWTAIGGVNGRKFTSKADTSKYIFFPAAGYVSGSSLNRRGGNVYVWSRSRYSSTYGWILTSSSGGLDVGTGSRYGGFSVRGVRI